MSAISDDSSLTLREIAERWAFASSRQVEEIVGILWRAVKDEKLIPDRVRDGAPTVIVNDRRGYNAEDAVLLRAEFSRWYGSRLPSLGYWWLPPCEAVAGGGYFAASPSRKRPGPTKGTVQRYGTPDRKLFPQIDVLTRDGGLSVSAAALKLARDKKVAGTGTPESRAKRLAKLYMSTAETR